MSEHRRKYEANMQHVEHPGMEYDRSDLGARGIIGFLIGLAATVIFIHLVVWGFMRTFEHFEPAPVARTSAISTPQAAKINPADRFPVPVLQSDEVGDMDRYREQVEQQLNSSGWVDPKAGIAHIPVERAMELVAQRGLPVRQQTDKPQPSNSQGGAPTQGSK